MTTTLPIFEVRISEQQPVCKSCGQALPADRLLQVNATTIADIYDVWPTRPSGKRVGPNLLIVELKVQR
jgi:hypothetical protein